MNSPELLPLEWKTISVKVKDLIPLEFNPRKISEEKRLKLTKSLEKFNLVEIPAVNIDYKILGGNQRVLAMMLVGRGDKFIDVRYPNRELTEQEVKEYVLISNTHAGEFDLDLLELNFSDVDFESIGFDIDLLKFENSDLFDKAYQKFGAGSDNLEATDDGFEIPAELETDIVLGDFFEIGPHKLICGDSTKIETFRTLLGEEIVDLVVTDPPYNVNYEGSNGLKIANDNMKSSEFFTFLYSFFSSLNQFVKKGGVWYVWHADIEGISFRKSMMDSGILLKQCLIWLKNSFVLGRQDYQWKHEPCLEGVNAENWEWVRDHEPCLYGWKAGAAHLWKGGRTQSTILEFDKPRRNADHPTMKPIELIGFQIKNSSNQLDIVADGFGGSGSTMVACHQLNRRARIVEYDPKYCQVIVNRMVALDASIEIKRNGKPWNIQKKS